MKSNDGNLGYLLHVDLDNQSSLYKIYLDRSDAVKDATDVCIEFCKSRGISECHINCDKAGYVLHWGHVKDKEYGLVKVKEIPIPKKPPEPSEN